MTTQEEEISTTTQVPVAKPVHASLYVGDLDPNVREPQLLELFKTCGTVLGVRVCRDIITQRSLGYGYVNFQTVADGEKALSTLNFTQVGDRFIRLMWQQRDPSMRYSGSGNVFVKNLGKELDSKGLHDLFKSYGTVLSCKIMMDESGQSRGYGFVHFKEETAASDAIERLNGSTKEAAEAVALYVSHFIRRNARIAALLANFTNVYIKQVLPSVDKDAIDAFFSKFGGITSSTARKDGKGRVFAFCNFKTHDDALKCIDAIHDTTVEGFTAPGEKIYVQRAQPRSERLVELRQKYMQRQSLGNNLYVRNFDAEFKDENLHELFREFGDIKSCRVMTDEKGNSRGFGFVGFATAEQANNALREMNGRMLNGKPLVVNIAQRRDQRYSMLQVQFQQRLQAIMRQLPLPLPFMIPGTTPPPRRGLRPPPAQPKLLPPHRQQVGGRGRGTYADALFQPPVQPYTVPRTPQQTPQAVPETPPLAPITADELQRLTAEDQKTALGERLYVKVAEITTHYAPKITGMFLEMDPVDALSLLDNPTKLASKVEEALCVLRAHQIAQ
jgi:polyadenylate-binding protein